MLDQNVPNPLAKNPNFHTHKVFAAIGLILIGTIVAAAGIWYFVQSARDKVGATDNTTVTKTATSSAKTTTTSAVLSNRKTISGQVKQWQSNKIYKFQFEAPTDFKTDHQSDNFSFYASNSAVSFFAGLLQGPSQITGVLGGKTSLCSNPLKIQEVYKNYFEVCDSITLNNQKALFLISLQLGGKTDTDPTCTAYAGLYIFQKVDNYTSLYFNPTLSVLNEVIKPWDTYVRAAPTYQANGAPIGCPDNADSSKVKANLQANIQNIRNGEGLSEQDNQILQTLYKMVSTFKSL